VHLSSLMKLESSNPAFLQQVEHSASLEMLEGSVICAHTSMFTLEGTVTGPMGSLEGDPLDDESDPHPTNQATNGAAPTKT
jgi:hypothetical protein